MNRKKLNVTPKGVRQYNGGMMREVREAKRIEAELRQENVLPENTKAHRLQSIWNPNKGKRVAMPKPVDGAKSTKKVSA